MLAILTPLTIDISKKSTAFIGLVLTLVDGKQLKMLGVKMSGKMEGLFTVQDVAKDHDLPGKV